MSTFYLLPPRPLLGARFADLLTAMFPGLEWSSQHWARLAEVLGNTVAEQPDVFIVYRDELPEGENVEQALAEGFGAQPGDDLIEVQPGTRLAETRTSRRQL